MVYNHPHIRLPLHHSEFEMVMEAQQNSYAGQSVALEAIGNFATDFRAYYGLRTQTVHTEAEPQPVHLKDLTQMDFEQTKPTIRGSPRFRYVLHLFAGAKRFGDLHSCIDIIADEEGAFLFPISLDVILDPVKGDLLH